MNTQTLLTRVLETLDNTKARDTCALDVAHRCDFTDVMVVCTGTSHRHLHSLKDKVIDMAKAAKNPPLGVEGTAQADWVLIDLGAVIVHIMTQEARAYYALEALWQPGHGDASS